MRRAILSIGAGALSLICLSITLVLPVDNRAEQGSWQLLVDDYLIAEKTGVIRTYHQFTKDPRNPVLTGDRPWENGNASVITVLPRDGGGYRIWYVSPGKDDYPLFYAESPDGLGWTKPSSPVRVAGPPIFTPWESDPARRYKHIGYDYGRTDPARPVSGFYCGYSSDGVHLDPAKRRLCFADWGDVGQFFWDPMAGRYLGYTKSFSPVRGYRRRCTGLTATREFEDWPSAQLILVPDEYDDKWVKFGENNQHTDFYNFHVFRYESGYIGLLHIFPITDGGSDGPIFVELASSRDGINWTRQEPRNGRREPVLPVGPEGTWDDGMVFAAFQPIVEGETIKLWYGGWDGTHGRGGQGRKAATGLCTLRKDGFASLDAGGEGGGVVTTRPLGGLSGQLSLNVLATNGWVKAELLDAAGRPVTGYSAEECERIQSDRTDHPVTWKNRKHLPEDGRSYRLRFLLSNASLFSFRAGSGLKLAEKETVDAVALNFESAALSPALKLSTGVSIVSDRASAAHGTGALKFEPVRDAKESSTLELLDTRRLGPRFCLAANVKTDRQKLTRLFSTYRGTGQFCSGEILFDFDPRCDAGFALRLVVNGQAVESQPVPFNDRVFHMLAAVYDRGRVTLYLDGRRIGEGRVKFGAVPVGTEEARYFARPEALPEVGIHLADNLRVGEDAGNSFYLGKSHIAQGSFNQQLSGFVDDLLVTRRALTEQEIRELYLNGL